MATIKTKAQLKDVFNGPSSLMYQSASLGNPMSLDPEYDVPVKVDTIEFEQGEPSIEHYKVIGLSGDWVSSSESGDITISFRVPTKQTDILKLAFGNEAVSSASVSYGNVYTLVDSPTGNPKTLGYYELDPTTGAYTATNDTTVTANKDYYSKGTSTFTGNGVVLTNKKVVGTWAILNDAGDQLLILNHTALYASMVMDTDAKGVVAIDFSGTIESDGSNPDVLFLRLSQG